MIQTFDTQLTVSLRALREVVAPALSNAEGHVVEQFTLALVTLEFMRQRLPHARAFHRLELQHLIDLSAEVRGVVGDDQTDLVKRMEKSEAIAQKELARPEAEVEDYLIVARELREFTGEAVRLSVDEPYETALDKLVITKQKELLTAQRVWCLPLGLDSRPDVLPTIEDLLSDS